MSARHEHFEASALAPLLRAQTPPRHWLAAVSGGLDSTVLLHAVASLRAALAPCRLRVVHVQHGLHADAPLWAARVSAMATELELPCELIEITVPVHRGSSPEAAAREARYAALAAALEAGEILLTAHHADDQLETVLLALLRGSGVAGLAAMPSGTPFGRGRHLRPLLGYTRAALAAYAQAHALTPCEDPSNLDRRFARNYLRCEVVPQLTRRWPSAARTVARSASLCAEAAELVDALASMDLERCERDGRVDLRALRQLTPARTRNLLRSWIRREQLPIPARAKLEQVLSDVLPARRDAQPLVSWPGAELRRHGDFLYLMAPLAPLPSAPLALAPAGAVQLGALGELRLEPCPGEGLSAAALGGQPMIVGFRRSTEVLRPVRGGPRRTLKYLFQTHAIVPWMRNRIPLLYLGGRLVAVGDLWIESELAAQGDEPGFRPRWSRHPRLR